jgi:hypothetical protein
MLNRTNAPVRASGSDDKRIGKFHPIFSTGLFGSYLRFPPGARLWSRVQRVRRPAWDVSVSPGLAWATQSSSGLGDLDLGGLTFGGLGLGCLPWCVCLDPWVEPPRDVTPPVCRAVAGSRVEVGTGGRPLVTGVGPGAEPRPGHAGRSEPVASAPDPDLPDPFPPDP